MKIPTKINQGDSISWDDDPTSDNLGNAIDSSAWTLKYALRGPSVLDLTAELNGSGWRTSITATQSGELKAGFYYWQAFATNGSSRQTLGSGRVEILKNLAAVAETFDGRSQARKDLDAVQTAIRALVGGGAIQEYTIGNRSFRKMTISDLRILESQLKYDVAQEEKEEKIKAGLGDPHSLYVRF